jgi:hypothetical protein
MTHQSSAASPARPIEVFYAYSHRDEALRDELETHLSILKRRGLISGWHDRRISGGLEWRDEISDHLNRADLILLLVSADFIASDYCFDNEMDRAMARHRLREARVIPIILRDCVWDLTPFSKLQALPRDGKPVTAWTSRDEAFKNVALGIKAAAEELGRIPAKPWKERPIVLARPNRPTARGPMYRSPVRSPRGIALHGPRIKITIGPPILSALANPPLEPPERPSTGRFVETDALLDTGAQRTVLALEAVQKAGLSKINEIDLQVVGGMVRADVYLASLQFPRSGLTTIEVIEVSCCASPHFLHPLYRCLLGRDVLSRWVLTYDGPAGTWQIREKAGAPWVEPPEGLDPDL